MRTWSVLSFTQKGVRYEIRETKDGLRCDCPIFVIKGKALGDCKHIKKVKTKPSYKRANEKPSRI